MYHCNKYEYHNKYITYGKWPVCSWFIYLYEKYGDVPYVKFSQSGSFKNEIFIDFPWFSISIHCPWVISRNL
jgi:hypothetical protein